jgi:hypothetical protein
MERFLTVVAFGGLFMGQVSLGFAQTPESVLKSETEAASGDLPPLPAAPKGKSTVIGGEIRSLDPVLDQFTLQVYGQKPIKVLFDARTQVFRDGNKIRLADLRTGEHASIQTVLDGTSVFAISIHMLSKTPEGELQGHVVSFEPGTHELLVSSPMSRTPTKLLVGPNTSIVREGQTAFTAAQSGQSDLVDGALILARFQSDKTGRAVASHISVLAIPGTAFVFSGNVATFDVHSGLLVVMDPRDGRSYQLFFDAGRFPAMRELHQGDHVHVSADFDGSRYVAREINP